MDNHKIKIQDKEFILYKTREEIESRIDSLAELLNITEPEDSNPIFLCVLNGGFLFFSELVKRINFNCEIDFIKIESYKGTERGDIKKTLNLNLERLKDRKVYIVEDIVDSGNTIFFLEESLKQAGVKSFKTLSLLYKPSLCKTNIIVDHSLFTLKDEFVVGYGLDYNQQGRNLTNLYTLC